MTRLSTLAIQTPEGIVFSYRLATPATRALAWAVDVAAIGTASSLASKAAEAAGLLSPDLATALGVALYFAVSIAYGIVFEWRWRGQTVGKRLLRLRVIDAGGLRLQLPQIALRNLLRAIDALPVFFLVGGIACLVSRRGQRLGDLAANTVVAHEREVIQADWEQVAPARYNSLLAHPHLAARLRSLADAGAVGMAAQALARRDEYDPAARIELFHDLADYFRALVEFPEAAREGLTDEQYVRSALRAIFERGSVTGAAR